MAREPAGMYYSHAPLVPSENCIYKKAVTRPDTVSLLTFRIRLKTKTFLKRKNSCS